MLEIPSCFLSLVSDVQLDASERTQIQKHSNCFPQVGALSSNSICYLLNYVNSVPGGIRTPDILLRRQALYPLSYRHNRCLQAFVRSQLGYFITGKSHVKAAPVQLSATELASWQWQVIVGQNDHTSQISKKRGYERQMMDKTLAC